MSSGELRSFEYLRKAITDSILFKGREWQLAKKEWQFGGDLESIAFRDTAECKRFLLATKILSIKLPQDLRIFSGGKSTIDSAHFLSKTLDWRYSLPGFDALKHAISTYVDFDTIPQEFWGLVPKIIDTLMIARTGLMCGGPHNKFEMADKALRMIDSGHEPGKYFTGKLPDELIAKLLIRTAELRDL